MTSPAARQPGGSPSAAALVACVVATVAFSVYTRTLLPGVDLGDTGGLQSAVLWPETSARQAYPLYFDLARPFVAAVSPANPARGLNLFSAVWAGVAAGLLTYVSTMITGSVIAGVAAGLLLAFSHTFWTQAIIAEVYALHLTLIGACLVALCRYQQRPTDQRLATFFAIYALSFGNHLSMILLLVPFALFLVTAHPRPRELLRPRVLALAVVIPLCAAMLYLPDFLFVWSNIDAPPRWSDRVAVFWFDVTKVDWRGAMVGGIDYSELRDRLAMWAWDARLQFGAAGLIAAGAGAVRLWTTSVPWALLVCSAYGINTVFVLTYNVGDSHVFFLPGHLLTVMAIASLFAMRTTPDGDPGPAHRRVRQTTGTVAASVLIAYAGWRAWDTWPSADRHDDRRAALLVAHAAAGVDDGSAILLSDMDWQAENALLYSARYERPRLAWTRVANVLPHLPFLVDDNLRIQRSIVLVGRAAERVASAYGPLFAVLPDGVPVPGLQERTDDIPRGTPYVLTLLEPAPEEPLDVADFDGALTALAGTGARRTNARFQIWAGMTGEPGAFHHESDRPFESTFTVLGDPFSVRMESWLPFEKFRRAGFGHVFRGRQRLLTIERGVSLIWFDRDNSPVVSYAASVYAPRPRARIPVSVPQQLADAILENSAADVERHDDP